MDRFQEIAEDEDTHFQVTDNLLCMHHLEEQQKNNRQRPIFVLLNVTSMMSSVVNPFPLFVDVAIRDNMDQSPLDALYLS